MSYQSYRWRLSSDESDESDESDSAKWVWRREHPGGVPFS